LGVDTSKVFNYNVGHCGAKWEKWTLVSLT
jgi:hypothetical protein